MGDIAISSGFELTAGTDAYSLILSMHPPLATLTSSELQIETFVDSPSGPVFSSTPTATVSGSITRQCGLSVFDQSSVIDIAISASNVVSYFYNANFGGAIVRGTSIEDTFELHQAHRTLGSPFQDVTIDMGCRVKAGVAVLSPQFEVTILNCDGDSNSTGISGQFVINSNSETAFWPPSTRVSSGTVSYPSTVGTDFGAAFDDDASLATNQELFWFGGQLQLPPALDFSTYQPPGPDYSATLNQCAWRYATFKFDRGFCDPVVRILGIEGTEWWANGEDSASSLPNDYDISIRMISLLAAIDTGWISCDPNRNLMATISPAITPYESNDQCRTSILLGCSDADTRVLNDVPFQNVEADAVTYIRLALRCDSATGKKVDRLQIVERSQAFQISSPGGCDDIHIFNDDASLSVQNGTGFHYYSALRNSNGSPSYMICDGANISFEPFFIQAGRSSFDIVYFLESYSLVDSGQSKIEQSRLDVQLPALSYSNNTAEHFSVLITDFTAQRDMFTLQISPNTSLQITTAAKYRLTFQISSDSGSHTTLQISSSDFYVDVPSPIQPSVSMLNQQYLGTTSTYFSGIKTVVQADPIQISFTASQFNTNFINPIVARCYGTGIVSTQLTYDDVSPVTDYIASKNLQFETRFADDTLIEDIVTHVKLNSCDPSLYQIVDTPLYDSTDKPVRLDSASQSIDYQVTSGQGEFPLLSDATFGQPYDHSVSLLSNEELQLYGGRFRLPVPRDFSQSAPTGSPDYTTLGQYVGWRWLTIKRNIFPQIHEMSIVFQDLMGISFTIPGAIGVTDGDFPIKCFLKLVLGDECESPWLDCNLEFDPYENFGSSSDGAGIMLCAGSDENTRRVRTAFYPYDVLFLRIGLKSPASGADISFKDINIPELL